jgi:hypothetical protein
MSEAEVAAIAQRPSHRPGFVVMVNRKLTLLLLAADDALFDRPGFGKRNHIGDPWRHARFLAIRTPAIAAPRVQSVVLSVIGREKLFACRLSLFALGAFQQFHARLAFRSRLSGSFAASGHIFI